MATNVQTAQGLGLAIFGAAAGGYLNYLESKAGDASALATELAGYYKAEMKKDLSVADVLANLQLKSGTAAYTAAKASLDMQVAGGATVAVAASSLVTYLFGLTDTTSDFYATATAFKARVDVAVAWSKGAGATEQSVTKLVAYQAGIDGSAPVDPEVPVVTTTALTVATDKLTGTSGADTFTGSTGLAGSSTLNAADVIDGGDGADTLSLNMISSFSGFTTGSMKGVETLSLTNTSSATRTFDATGSTGITTVDIAANKVGFTLSNLAAVGQTVNLSGAGAAATLTVGYASSDITKATTDALSVNLSDAGASAAAPLAIRAVGIETLNIGSNGATANFVDAAVGGSTKVVVTGANALTFAGIDATLRTLDASAASGKITADVRGSAVVTSVTTGSADDSVTVGDMGTAVATLAGGAGADVLTFRGTTAGTYQPTVTGFETVTFRSLEAATTLVDFSKSADITSIRLTDSVTNGGTLQTSGLSNASFVVKQSAAGSSLGTGDLNYAGTGSLTYATDAITSGSSVTGAITAAKADSVSVTVGAGTTVGTQTYIAAQDVTQTISGTLGTLNANKAESLKITSDSTGVIGTAAISAAAASAVTISASKSGTLSTLGLAADLAKTVTISGAGAVGYTTTALGSVSTLTVSTSGAYSDANAVIGDKSASLTYDASGVVGNATLNVAAYGGTSTAAAVVVKGSAVGGNTVNIGGAHASVDITGGIGVNAISLGVFGGATAPGATAPQVVKVTTSGIADTDTLTFVAGEDLSGLYATVTLSGVDTISAGVGTLKLNASAISGQTLKLGDGTNQTDVTLIGTTSADTINLANVTLGATSTLTVDGGTGADTITGGAGVDTILGDAGNDSISGGDGNDVITGGAGADIMTGGTGADTFAFTTASTGLPSASNFDTITDYTRTVGTVTGDTISATALILGAQTATAGPGVATITAGLATFNAADTTFAQHLAAVAAAQQATAGAATIWQEGADSYLFISDGSLPVAATDVLIKLTGITAGALTVASNAITGIA